MQGLKNNLNLHIRRHLFSVLYLQNIEQNIKKYIIQ